MVTRDVAFYTGGFPAPDYWSVSATYKTSDSGTKNLWSGMQHYDLHGDDAGVMVMMDIRLGSYSYATANNVKMDMYSNDGSSTDHPMYDL